MGQLHKRFSSEQVKDLMQRYINKELSRDHIQQILRIGRRRFFKLLKEYRQNPDQFSIQYSRTGKTRSINPTVEKNILTELAETKKLIDHKDIPVRHYNYSFIQKEIVRRYKQTVSVPTIISRAKEHGFYVERPKAQKVHDREVITKQHR